MRLPQEDFCQVLGFPSAKKYKSDNGPGIKEIMSFLLGSTNAQIDRLNFMKSQVFFLLLAATDGHAKNFSIFINMEGSYNLTPFYDIISLYPVINSKGLNIRNVKLSMGLKATKGKKYHINKIQPRHFINTAKFIGFDQNIMLTILKEFKENTPHVIAAVKKQLPNDFPKGIMDPILVGLETRSKFI